MHVRSMLKHAAALRDESSSWTAFEREVLPHADRLFRLAMWLIGRVNDPAFIAAKRRAI